MKEKTKEIDITKIKIKPYKLSPELLETLKKDLITLKGKADFHKANLVQLNSDIEEIEETILNAGVTKEMLESWGIEQSN